MKKRIYSVFQSFALLFFLMYFSFDLHAQPAGAPPCVPSTSPGETACLATPICGFNGYCGRTLSTYTSDAWTELKKAICAATNSFWIGGNCSTGMTVENDSYLKFIATSNSVTFNIYVYDCHGTGSTAIQVVFFEAASCSSGPVTIKSMNSNLPQQATAHTVTASGLTPGQTYYILIDGMSGEDCGYTFEAVDGISTGVSIDKAPSVTACPGDIIQVTASGGSGTYTWSSSSSGLSSTSGASVSITAPASQGTYNYSVTATGGNAFCPQSSTDDVDIVVGNCTSCTPPNLTINPLKVCFPNTANLTTAIGAGSDASTKTYYSSQNDATNATNPIGTTVSTSGSYWVRAETPSDATCFKIYEVQVTITKVTYTAANTNATCGQTDGSIVLTANGGATPYSYSIDNGANYQSTNTFSNLAANSYTVVVKDNNGCMASGTENVSSPGASNPSFSLTNYCEGASNSASNIATAGGTFAFNPATTDGATIDATTGAITNGVGGTTYTVEYSLTGACPAKSTKTVTVIKTPTANFTANPTVADLSNPTVNFTNSSQNATSYSWNFGDGSAMDNNTNPTHTYPNTNAGTYTVILTVSNGGCTATKSATIQIDSLIIEYSVPNVFSPNGDGVNDEFIFISSLNLKSVKTTILNRWGNVVFTSNDINFKWNGKDNSGQNCTEGTYFYKMEIESLNNKKYQEHGFVTIQR